MTKPRTPGFIPLLLTCLGESSSSKFLSLSAVSPWSFCVRVQITMINMYDMLTDYQNPCTESLDRRVMYVEIQMMRTITESLERTDLVACVVGCCLTPCLSPAMMMARLYVFLANLHWNRRRCPCSDGRRLQAVEFSKLPTKNFACATAIQGHHINDDSPHL